MISDVVLVVVCHGVRWGRTQTQESSQALLQTKGFISPKTETDRELTLTRVRTRQRLDTKQELKYTEPNKTRVDMIRQM